MTPDPKQLARETAEECAAIIISDVFGHPYEVDVQTILHKLNLEQLIADKQRLEWLENCYDWQLRPTPEKWLCKSDHKLRQAIDNAMKEEQK